MQCPAATPLLTSLTLHSSSISPAVLPSLFPSYPTQISVFSCCLSLTCFLATELTCPLFSVLQICACNSRLFGAAYINHLSPRGGRVVFCVSKQLCPQHVLFTCLDYRFIKATVEPDTCNICCNLKWGNICTPAVHRGVFTDVGYN